MKIPAILVPLICVSATACASFSWPTSASDDRASHDTLTAEQTDEAISALERMSEFLGSRPTLRFTADIQYDAVQTSGQKIDFGSQRRIALRPPDRARVEVSHWDGERELVTFDGERISVAMPERRVYASMRFTGTIGAAFDHLVADQGVASPLLDLLRRDLANEVKSRVLSARRLRTATIAGTPCDHLAFHGPRVDFQLFIRQGGEPVPVRFVIDYHAEPGSPQFRAQLLDWDLEAELPDSLFLFAPPAGAQRVPFAELLDLLLGPALDPEEGNP